MVPPEDGSANEDRTANEDAKANEPRPVEILYRQLRDMDEDRDAARGARDEIRRKLEAWREEDDSDHMQLLGALLFMSASDQWDASYDDALRKTHEAVRMTAIADAQNTRHYDTMRVQVVDAENRAAHDRGRVEELSKALLAERKEAHILRYNLAEARDRLEEAEDGPGFIGRAALVGAALAGAGIACGGVVIVATVLMILRVL